MQTCKHYIEQFQFSNIEDSLLRKYIGNVQQILKNIPPVLFVKAICHKAISND